VIVLMIAYGASLIDRQILSLMVDPVRADLNLSDTELSFLHGFAFALFYTGFGIPLGWVADHWNRSLLILIGLFVWGGATVSCGLVGSFAGLFVARMAVGMGEAALSPAAYSIIYDYFAPAKRGRAMSLYSIGVFLGAAAAYIVGGAAIEFGGAGVDWLARIGLEVKPWQFVFVLVGSMSLAVLVLVATVREPQRRVVEHDVAPAHGSNPFSCIGYVWRQIVCLGTVAFYSGLRLVSERDRAGFRTRVARAGNRGNVDRRVLVRSSCRDGAAQRPNYGRCLGRDHWRRKRGPVRFYA
jgi:MFS family permease